MPVRLKDVAQHAGVSIKTVSNVVNHQPNVSPAMRERVEAAISELGYRPNLAARQLKHGRGGFIALAVPRLDSPYFAEIAARFSAEAIRRGYLFLLDITGADYQQERLALSGMRTHMIDGMIFSPLTISAQDISERRDGIPLVMLGERAVPEALDHVAVDSVSASAAVAAHFCELGRTRPAAIGREPGQGTASLRLQGFSRYLGEAGIELPSERIVEVPEFDRAAGYGAMRHLLALPTAQRPDAVFAFNDLMAIGALRACLEWGVDVPGDIAVAGFDDIPEGRFHSPTLTTIAPDLDALTTSVLDLLIGRIEGSDAPPARVRIPWSLQVRESTRGRSPADR